MRAIFAAALCAISAASGPVVQIGNLSYPVGFAWDSYGRIYAAEKDGLVKIARSWLASSFSQVVLDLTSRVATYGDMGITAIDVAPASTGVTYLYVSFMTINAAFGDNCTDSGRPNGRAASAMVGCPTTGRISRWALDASGLVSGSEEVLVLGTLTSMCTQFRVHGFGYILADGDTLYFSAGAGENANVVPDYGQFGGDPCGNNGAFRSRAAGVLNGRISKLDIPSATTTTLALGLKNPWRFSISPSGAYIAEPGSGNYDEINGPLSLSRSPSATPIDYGFPCYEASSPYSAYANFSTCQSLSPAAVTNPFYAYTGVNGSRISVSAIAYRAGNGRVYYGDYSQSIIASLPSSGASDATKRIEATGVFPVDMAYVPNVGITYVDILGGIVTNVPDTVDSGAGSSKVTAAVVAVAAVGVAASLLL